MFAFADVDSIVVQEEEDLKTDNKDVHPVVVVPRGETWSVHKFGGTCVGSCERIQNVAKIILNDPSLRKAVVVSAMAKVTDMMKLHEKHKDTATALLDDHDALSKFLATLEHDVHNLRAMLRAIYIGVCISMFCNTFSFPFFCQSVRCSCDDRLSIALACFSTFTSLESSDYVGVFVCWGFWAFCAAGHATELFADFVVGHGELWSAQMLAATVSQVQNSLTTPSPLHCTLLYELSLSD